MKNIIFVLFTGFLVASTLQPVNSQTWEAFLERHVDNLNNADNVPGLSHQYSDEAIQKKRSEMLSLIYNNHRKLYQEPTGIFDPLKYPTHNVFGKNEMNSMNAVLSLGTDKEKQNARNLLYNAMLYTGGNPGNITVSPSGDIFFTSFYISGYLLNLKPEVFTPDKERDLREFYTDNTAGIWGHSFWGYGTENHSQMHRSTAYGAGLKWPDHSFIVRRDGSRESGKYIFQQIEEKHIRNYIGYLYR